MFENWGKLNIDSAAIYLHISMAVVSVADVCIQLFGDNITQTSTLCGRYWRDAKLYDIGGGTKEFISGSSAASFRKFTVSESIQG